MLNCAIEAIRPDKVLVIPVGCPWKKQRLPFASAAHRCAMLKIALPNTLIDERELKREGPTYTVDSLRELSLDNPSASFYWLIGSDSFAGLDSWRESAILATLATFAVVRRDNDPIVPPREKFRFREVICTPSPVSSTCIRERLSRREPIQGLVPDAVYDYIQQHNLYFAEQHS